MNLCVPENEDHETRLRRLRMRSWRRGMKEMDLILGNFADTALRDLNLADLDAHEALMNEPDQDLYAWISGAYPVPDVYKPALERILANMSKISSEVSQKPTSLTTCFSFAVKPASDSFGGDTKNEHSHSS